MSFTSSTGDEFFAAPHEWKCSAKGCTKDAAQSIICPTCRCLGYCGNECRVKDWDGKHWKKCKDTLKEGAEFFALINPVNKKKLLKFFKTDSEKTAVPKNLPKGFSLEIRNDRLDTPLCIAADLGEFSFVELFLRLGAGINRKGSHGNTPLHYAARKGFGLVVKTLIKNGADVMATNNDGDTPLHLAAFGGHQFAVLALLGAKVDVLKKNSGFQTPLDAAVNAKQFHLVGLLLDHEPSYREKPTLLINAIRSKNAEYAAVLVENGISIEAKSDKGLTAVEEATAVGLTQFHKLLEEKRARDELSGAIKIKNKEDDEARKVEEARLKEEEEKKAADAAKAAEEKKAALLQAEEDRKAALAKAIAERDEADRQYIENQKGELDSLTSSLSQQAAGQPVNKNLQRAAGTQRRASTVSTESTGSDNPAHAAAAAELMNAAELVSADGAIQLTVPEPTSELQVQLNALLEFRHVHRMIAFMIPAYDSMKKASTDDGAVIVQGVKEVALQTAQAISLCKSAIEATFEESVILHCRTKIGNLTHSSAILKESVRTFMTATEEEAKTAELEQALATVKALIDHVYSIVQIAKLELDSIPAIN
ncbi:hypothetical protein CAOG_00896 [Capsaspora owczarzaki ATCC 30864]|uniref:MYND-type domain-containing protein n=1 Tax=Capsaspora owczarzaki (strain ATCC 30864) TaxID=595528 RepID=A0A0D2VHJ7_CAPO3|nr:hypothetical protein CAOG_00896 [Capsaspora owczarzaki ATCC 30864]KJE89427.1 hypothetical protein CAOG_000896 [Capsaspora owczarzaki ATCC 30864]|eukprot:XP_004365767.2 hypothetical protein CAOG_00896 [Capsaspora owczarzaki ATCC 30864]